MRLVSWLRSISRACKTILRPAWATSKPERIHATVKNFHLQSGYEKAAADGRTASFRRRYAPPELQEGGGRTWRHANGDQPPNPNAGGLLRPCPLPPAAAAAV